MIDRVEFKYNQSNSEEIGRHLDDCDSSFSPALSTRVNIQEYASKIHLHAFRCEAWSDNQLIGLVAAYLNGSDRQIGFITSVSVLNDWSGKGIATKLLSRCMEQARLFGFSMLQLEVSPANLPALSLYKRLGFVAQANSPTITSMKISLESSRPNE